MGIKQVCIVLGVYYSKEIFNAPRTRNAEDKELAEYTPRTKSAENKKPQRAQRKKTRI